MLEVRKIRVLAYNMATILAEKLETVISRGDQNTRPRDYYDIYILSRVQGANIDMEALSDALRATVEKRGSAAILRQYRKIMEAVRTSEPMKKLWENYRKDFDYAAGIEFPDSCEAVLGLMEKLSGQEKA